MASSRAFLARRMAGNLRGTRQLTTSVVKQPHALTSATSVISSTKWREFSTSYTYPRNQSAQTAPAPVAKQTKHASMRIEDGVAVITLDSPGVNWTLIIQFFAYESRPWVCSFTPNTPTPHSTQRMRKVGKLRV